MRNEKSRNFAAKFFKDDKCKVVMWQRPNIPIIGWVVFKLLSMLFDSGNLKSGLSAVSTAFLFTWAYLEAAKGVSNFRKALGIVVLIAVVIGYIT